MNELNLMAISKVLSAYGSSLFLTEDELREYSGGRDSKKMMVFELDGVIRYPEPKSLGRGITMVGEYMVKEGYEKLIHGG